MHHINNICRVTEHFDARRKHTLTRKILKFALLLFPIASGISKFLILIYGKLDGALVLVNFYNFYN